MKRQYKEECEKGYRDAGMQRGERRAVWKDLQRKGEESTV